MYKHICISECSAQKELDHLWHNRFFQLFMYEALGLCEEGQGGNLVDGGQWIRNTNGWYSCIHTGLSAV